MPPITVTKVRSVEYLNCDHRRDELFKQKKKYKKRNKKEEEQEIFGDRRLIRCRIEFNGFVTSYVYAGLSVGSYAFKNSSFYFLTILLKGKKGGRIIRAVDHRNSERRFVPSSSSYSSYFASTIKSNEMILFQFSNK